MTLTNTLIIAYLFVAHPVHIGYTHLDVDPVKKTVTVSHKILKDDFTLLFFHLYEKNIESRPGIDFTTEELRIVNKYMQKHFIISAGNDTINLSFQHKDDSEDSYLWMYYSGNLPDKSIQEITINNMLLFDINMDQTNLVILNYGNIQKGLRFDWQNNKEIVAIQ